MQFHSNKYGRLIPVLGCLYITLLVTFAIGVDLSPFLRGPGEWPPEWRWPYGVTEILPQYTPALVFVISLMALWWCYTQRQPDLQHGHLIVWWLLGISLILSIHCVSARGFGLSILFRSMHVHSGEYFKPASAIANIRTYLRTYGDQMSELPPKLATHPPGNVVFFWCFHRITALLPDALIARGGSYLRSLASAWYVTDSPDAYLVSSAFAGLGVVSVTLLTVFPLYWLGRDLFGHQRAQQGIVLFLLVPALSMLTPTVDQIYTFIAVSALWFLYYGLSRYVYWAFLFSGAFLSMGVFMSFSLLPLWLIAVLFGLWWTWRDAKQGACGEILIRAAYQGGLVLVGASLVWIASGIKPIIIFQQAMSSHNVIPEIRSYWAWLFYNPYDLLLFLGTPAAIFVFMSGVRVVKRIRNESKSLQARHFLFLSIVLSMLLLFVSGKWRGETARALAYFYPLLILLGQVEGTVWSPGTFLLICGATLYQNIVFYATVAVG